MMTDREKLVALVWRRMPASLKIVVGGVKFVSESGNFVSVDSMSDGELFSVLRKTATVKSLLKSLEAA